MKKMAKSLSLLAILNLIPMLSMTMEIEVAHYVQELTFKIKSKYQKKEEHLRIFTALARTLAGSLNTNTMLTINYGDIHKFGLTSEVVNNAVSSIAFNRNSSRLCLENFFNILLTPIKEERDKLLETRRRLIRRNNNLIAKNRKLKEEIGRKAEKTNTIKAILKEKKKPSYPKKARTANVPNDLEQVRRNCTKMPNTTQQIPQKHLSPLSTYSIPLVTAAIGLATGLALPIVKQTIFSYLLTKA